MHQTLVTQTQPRWVGVGFSDELDSALATRQALESAIDGRPTVLTAIFASSAHDLTSVARAAKESVADDVAVIGCSTSGEFAGLRAGSGAVVVVAMGGEGLVARTAVGMLADGPRQAGQDAAAALIGMNQPHQALLLLCDGLSGGRSDVVRGAYGVAGAAVPLIGGCAGDDLAMTQTFQLHGGEVLTGAVVGAAIGSSAPIGIGVGHGWRRIGEPVVVTESDGNRIFRLNDEPALDYYLRAVNAAPEESEDGSLWRHISLRHPFGLPRPGGEEVRAVLGADYGDRSLFCGDVPQGTVIRVMEGDVETIIDGTRIACAQALASLGGSSPLGIVAFDCAARRAVLGEDGIRAEMQVIADLTPGVPVGGFYTYGEFARTSGSRGVHNATLALLALA